MCVCVCVRGGRYVPAVAEARICGCVCGSAAKIKAGPFRIICLPCPRGARNIRCARERNIAHSGPRVVCIRHEKVNRGCGVKGAASKQVLLLVRSRVFTLSGPERGFDFGPCSSFLLYTLLIQMHQRKHDMSSLAGVCLNMIKLTAFFFVQYGQPELDHRNHRLSFTPRFYQQAPPPGYDPRVQYSLP